MIFLVPLLRVITLPMISSLLVRLSRYLDLVPAQAIYYLVILTLIGRMGEGMHVLFALGVFVLLRVGVIDLLFDPIVRWISTKLFKMRPDDVALRSLLINTAALHGLSLKGHDEFGSKGNIFLWKS